MAKASAAVRGRPGDRWWRGLAARATLAVGAMLATLSVLLIGVNASDVRSEVQRSLELQAADRVEGLASRLRSGDLDPRGLTAAADLSGLSYGFLETAAGAPASGVRPAGGVPSPSAEGVGETEGAALAVVASQGGVAHVAKALTVSGEPMTLKAGLSLAAADAAGRNAAVRGLVAALAFLALALPGLAIMVDRAASPLRALTRAVTLPGAAQSAVEAGGERGDEVGALARAHLSIARDLAENADALHRLTFDDPLTRLPNRASLTSRLAVALQLGQHVALLMVEVHGLSRIAAGLGQQFGDEAVRRAADRLIGTATDWTRDQMPSEDQAPSEDQPLLLARVSDTGFALLARGSDAGAARALADSALAAFEAPLFVGEHHVTTTLAIGVALAPDDGDEAGALLRSASAAVSAAHAAGPQSVRFAGAELNRMAYGRLKLEQDLRRAIDDGELELHYQPQILLRGDHVSGAEALVRWRHPIRGLVSPMEFVPLAEECGLIEPLWRLVLARAGRTAAGWHARGMPLRIAVNVSPVQFKRARFADRTLEIIRASGADASMIELEITESAAMVDPEHAARELAPLKAAGVRIAIDDFGTGYSNLASLTHLPFDVLKIDRAFVRDASTVAGARVVVGTVIGMAENLGFETVAEGVETVEQLDFVTSHGCTYAQGYLFGKPMPAAAFETWYERRMVDELRALAGRHRAPTAGASAATALGGAT